MFCCGGGSGSASSLSVSDKLKLRESRKKSKWFLFDEIFSNQNELKMLKNIRIFVFLSDFFHEFGPQTISIYFSG